MAVVVVIGLLSVIQAGAADDTATQSRLATGRWMRVRVSETGMQLVTKAQISAQGLNPAKTRVYGYGGRMVPELFPQGLPDDLPLQPSVTTTAGIVFYGTDHVTWNAYNNHTPNPYSEDSWYFLSDADPGEVADLPEAELLSPSADGARTTFSECLVHEQDLYAPSHSGRRLLGEDFRSPTSRSFAFQLPGNTGEPVTARVNFASLITNGRGLLTFTANGKTLDTSTFDNLNTSASSENFMNMANISKTIVDAGNSLNFGISLSASGSVTLARLDWIEVIYTRALELQGSDLHFALSVTPGESIKVDGCSADTRIWDVTLPHAPREVRFTLSGQSALFAPAEGGYREYVAFNPAQVKRSVTPGGKVGNQNIHSLPTPDMVIISPSEYLNASERLAEMHRKTDGMIVHVLTPQAIYNEFSSGTPDVGAFRKMLNMWYRRSQDSPEGPQTRYCLIMSKPTYDNKMVTSSVKSAGYPRVPIWQSPTGNTLSSSYSTDDFIGMLDYDMSGLSQARIHVAVGRLPVTSVVEAEQMVDKIINYVTNPEYGSWRNHVMLVADDQDNGAHMTQMENVYTRLTSEGNGKGFIYDKVYFDAYPIVPTSSGNTYPGAKSKMLGRWNEGVGFINYIGHANPVSWSHEKVLLWEDITSFSNDRLPILYAATCEFACWDADSKSGAEVMLLNPKGGFVAGIIPSRSVFITKNGLLSNYTMQEFYKRDADGKGRRLGDIMLAGKNAYFDDENKLRYCLLGDPALRILSPSHSVVTETIGDLPADAEAQIIGARSSVKVTGLILNPDGTPADDFNGIIEVSLYDAERAVTSNGHGSEGKPVDFNDRSVRLTTESCAVTAGRWETVLRLPGEIENNFSPAMLSYYAYSDAGMEANGMCDNLYVYGYDENAADDSEGPVIELFTLNHNDFSSGDATHRSPIVMATFSDPSGINLSDASVGHDITLRLDGKTSFDDVSSRYTPDPYREGAGSIVYNLDELEPGTHELELKVWDNAGNSSTATLQFNVAVHKSAGIQSFAALPVDGSTLIHVALDRPANGTSVLFEIYTMSGRRIWHSEVQGGGRTSNVCSTLWDRKDDAGRDVSRDIYICRATVTTEDGSVTRASTKIATGAN